MEDMALHVNDYVHYDPIKTIFYKTDEINFCGYKYKLEKYRQKITQCVIFLIFNIF